MTHVDPSAPDCPATRLLLALSRALKSVSTPLRSHLETWTLTPTEFTVLEVLHRHGPLPLGEVADRVRCTAGNATYTVKRLEERGLVQRCPCGQDQRVVYGRLTDAGAALVADVMPAHAEQIRASMSALSPEEQQSALALLSRLGAGPDPAPG